jgi:hypothetical protein
VLRKGHLLKALGLGFWGGITSFNREISSLRKKIFRVGHLTLDRSLEILSNEIESMKRIG